MQKEGRNETGVKKKGGKREGKKAGLKEEKKKGREEEEK